MNFPGRSPWVLCLLWSAPSSQHLLPFSVSFQWYSTSGRYVMTYGNCYFQYYHQHVVAKTRLLGLPKSGLIIVWVVIIVIGPSGLYIEALALLWVTSVCSSNSSWPLTWSTTDVSSQLMGGDLLHMLCYSWLHCHLRAENGVLSIEYTTHSAKNPPCRCSFSLVSSLSIWSSQYSPGHGCTYMIHHESYPLVVSC